MSMLNANIINIIDIYRHVIGCSMKIMYKYGGFFPETMVDVGNKGTYLEQ